MAHQDRGHYAAKHEGKKIDPRVKKELEQLAKEGSVSCSAAHQAAESKGILPGDIGVQLDLLELRLTHCQLGLFGYKGGQKKLDPDIEIPPELEGKIEALAVDGRISCSEAWKLADESGISRLEMGSACEKKGVRLKPCQLGAF